MEPSTQTVREFLTDRWLPDKKASRKPSTHASYEHHVKALVDRSVPEGLDVHVIIDNST